MEKQNFCKLLTILAVVCGWNLTGCRNDDASVYQKFDKAEKVEAVENSSGSPEVDNKPAIEIKSTVEIKPTVAPETAEKPKKTVVSQASVDSSIKDTQEKTEPVIQVSQVEGPAKEPLEDKKQPGNTNQTDNTNQPEEKLKPSNPQDKSNKLPAEEKKETENKEQEKKIAIKKAQSLIAAERMALLQNRNNPDKKIKKPVKREVKILIPDKKFLTTGKNKALRVSYDDIDLLKVINMEPVTPDVAEKMPQWLLDLDGKRIRIRGFMFPTYVESGIEKFALARDNDICCFISTPKIYDVFTVFMRKGVTTNYIEGRPFDVEGVFHVKVEAEEGIMLQLYFIDDAIIIKK